MTRILFKNASVFDGTTPYLHGNHHVLVEGGLIRELSPHPITGEADTVVDVAGRTLMPGLIELHVHIWAADMSLTALSQRPSEYIALFAAAQPGPGVHHTTRCRWNRRRIRPRH